MEIGIIDYGAGNLKSVENALSRLGVGWRVYSSGGQLDSSVNGLILPGVGAFGDAMRQLEERGFCQILRAYAVANRPLLGICLGLQLLFEYSEESPGVRGLGVFEGGFRRFPSDLGLKVPHIGWNRLDIVKKDGVFRRAPADMYAYFVHSFYLDAQDKSIVSATTRYGVRVDAAVERGNISACQFHPEKSGEDGLGILQSFAEICAAAGKEA